MKRNLIQCTQGRSRGTILDEIVREVQMTKDLHLSLMTQHLLLNLLLAANRL
jgi:hypothetical protein